MTPPPTALPPMHDRWAPALNAPSRPLLRLYCFPYAGGGPAVFHHWPASLPEQVEVRAVQLPGHGPRLREKPLERMTPLVQSLTEALYPAFDPLSESALPFVFFGHSGARSSNGAAFRC